MITKYNQFNESIKSLLVGPTKEEIWKSFGYDQSFDTPEEFLLYVIDGISIKVQTKYTKSIFWVKNDKLLFEQDLKNKELFVDYESIWVVFEKIFNLEYKEIQSFISNIVEEHLNWKGFTPFSSTTSSLGGWKKF